MVRMLMIELVTAVFNTGNCTWTDLSQLLRHLHSDWGVQPGDEFSLFDFYDCCAYYYNYEDDDIANYDEDCYYCQYYNQGFGDNEEEDDYAFYGYGEVDEEEEDDDDQDYEAPDYYIAAVITNSPIVTSAVTQLESCFGSVLLVVQRILEAVAVFRILFQLVDHHQLDHQHVLHQIVVAITIIIAVTIIEFVVSIIAIKSVIVVIIIVVVIEHWKKKKISLSEVINQEYDKPEVIN
ncbi:MAG: hypothetical protein EZS28_027775 [Streblomastix strix]|uniref:Uncharacterized protein n=1 Tax=Streblomastix strix TaxID=222440 RepID=A0A5J4V1U0_9EUKA|nr:MAG: hypothetical protein EZS28_027775 [Streblomastix strix]